MSSERSSTFLISPKQVSTHLGSSARQKAWDTDAFTQNSLYKNTLYYKACTKHVPVLLCTTKLAQNTSQYYFVLQSLHKALPSTTLYYKNCTKYVPALLCTTKLAQSTSQYYFVLQSLHKLLPSTTLYYKACTKYVPALLCTTKLAQSTSQYYFVLQSLHKALPSTTLYHKAFTHRTLAQSAFTHGKRLHVQKLLHRDAFTQREAFTHSKLLHTFFLHTASFYRKKFLHREAFLYIITTGIAAPKPDGSRRQSEKRGFWNTF